MLTSYFLLLFLLVITIPSLIIGDEPTHPTSFPSAKPSSIPTSQPNGNPTSLPSAMPTLNLSALPSSAPSFAPTLLPSSLPSSYPSSAPSQLPSSNPTSTLNTSPSSFPTYIPTSQPTKVPSSSPTTVEFSYPSGLPTGLPTGQPIGKPSGTPTSIPSTIPSSDPTAVPSSVPSSKPSLSPTHPTIAPTYLVKSSSPPTISPSNQFLFSLRPTVLTTSNSPVVKFYLNISFSQVLSNTLDVLSEQVIVNTTAVSMGVSAAFLRYLSSYQVSANDNRHKSILDGSLDFVVELFADIPINLYGYDQVSDCYDNMTNQLTDSIESGSYTEYLQQLSQEVECTTLSTAVATNVTFLQITDSSPSSNDDFLGSSSSIAIIVGVVIALVIVVVVIGCLLYQKGTFQRGSRKYSRMSTNIEIPSRQSSLSDDSDDVFHWNFKDGSRGSTSRTSNNRNPNNSSSNSKKPMDLTLGESKTTNPILQRQTEEEWWL